MANPPAGLCRCAPRCVPRSLALPAVLAAMLTAEAGSCPVLPPASAAALLSAFLGRWRSLRYSLRCSQPRPARDPSSRRPLPLRSSLRSSVAGAPCGTRCDAHSRGRLVTKRVRLNPDTRRAQLVELGVRMLATRRLEDLSVEALAEQAGISRGLLFHYFRSKQEFHLEVVRAAARELLARTAPDVGLAPLEQLTTSLAAFIDYVTENRDAYVSLVRGAASGDATVRRVSDETRTELANRVLKHLDALGLPADTRTEIAVHS